MYKVISGDDRFIEESLNKYDKDCMIVDIIGMSTCTIKFEGLSTAENRTTVIFRVLNVS